jgi:hypothetical protein
MDAANACRRKTPRPEYLPFDSEDSHLPPSSRSSAYHGWQDGVPRTLTNYEGGGDLSSEKASSNAALAI